MSLDRRQFMARAGRAGLALAGAAGLGIGLHTWESRPLSGEAVLRGLPDFSRQGTEGRLAVVKGRDRQKALALALELMGGMGDFITPGERVLIKVNAAFASPPSIGATTNPESLKALIGLCLEAGAREVLVSDNPIQDPGTCFSLSGLAQATAAAGGRLVLPRPGAFQPLTLPGARLIVDWPVLTGPLNQVDRVIGLAPVKDHHRSGASLAMKNWYGLLGGRRNVFHQDIFGIITELATLVRPTLVILDGVQSMLTNGPTGGSMGDLADTATMIASTDQVAADALGAGLLGKRPQELPFIMRAQAAGLGSIDLKALSVKRGEV